MALVIKECGTKVRICFIGENYFVVRLSVEMRLSLHPSVSDMVKLHTQTSRSGLLFWFSGRIIFIEFNYCFMLGLPLYHITSCCTSLPHFSIFLFLFFILSLILSVYMCIYLCILFLSPFSIHFMQAYISFFLFFYFYTAFLVLSLSPLSLSSSRCWSCY